MGDLVILTIMELGLFHWRRLSTLCNSSSIHGLGGAEEQKIQTREKGSENLRKESVVSEWWVLFFL